MDGDERRTSGAAMAWRKALGTRFDLTGTPRPGS